MTTPTRSFYDRISRVYDLLTDSSEHASREEGVGALEVAADDTILEIGCGTGHALVDLANDAGERSRVFGIDLSAGMLDVARRRVDSSAVAQRIDLCLADGRRLPFARHAFDAVFASFTLELFELDEIPLVLAEIRRVLVPGGRLGLVAMAEKEKHSLGVDLYKWMHRHFPHIVDCQPIDANGILKQAGFAVRDRRQRSIWSLPVEILVAQPS